MAPPRTPGPSGVLPIEPAARAAEADGMGWKEHVLRRLARGPEAGASLDARRLLRVVRRIEDDPALSADLDERDEEWVWQAVLALYEQVPGPR